MYRRLLLLTAFCLLALVTNLSAYFFFHWIDGLVAGGATQPVVLRMDFPLLMRIFLPMGAIALAVPCLLIEAVGLGWRQSSLRRLLYDNSNSTYTDLFYLMLTVCGLKPLLAFLMSLGAGYGLNALLAKHFAVHLLSNAPFAVSLAVLTIVNTFIFYWVHRAMHTPLFWEVHKVHHSAEHLNIITPHRNHPFDMVVVTIMNSLPAAILGASPTVILIYTVVNSIYQQMVHSHWDWKLRHHGMCFIESHLVFLSAGHQIHHSDIREHWNKNFGITPVWDRLFGTYYQHSADEKVSVGLHDGSEVINTGRPIWEIWVIYRHWLRTAVTLLRDGLRAPFKQERRLATDAASREHALLYLSLSNQIGRDHASSHDNIVAAAGSRSMPTSTDGAADDGQFSAGLEMAGDTPGGRRPVY
ncbi:MAG TPA: sterol desaturase family protein [Pirellulales bacterium]|jgi:sterol desaturase/sphingolipid hydroxylase (fatty acid hydroxylase superfamily)|nr:sterol desaturase family protein [Pirellulales bacterium]